jgi:flagellar export protein FliJ
MADLSVLIRLQKHELDEKRRTLGDLYAALSEIERRKRELEREFEQEKQSLKNNNDVHYTFAQYTDSVIKKRKEFAEAEAELEKNIEKAKLSLLDTFSELKKFEMTQEERERIEADERLFRENRDLDAIGLETFRRKED